LRGSFEIVKSRLEVGIIYDQVVHDKLMKKEVRTPNTCSGINNHSECALVRKTYKWRVDGGDIPMDTVFVFLEEFPSR
jgi:hypothetical protein